MKWLTIIVLLCLPCSASIANIYYALASAGANDGTTCANAYAYNDATNGFNAATKWGAGATQIGSDTVVHLCGAFTGTTNVNFLTFQGSGTTGHPVTVLFESGAIMKPSYCSSNGCIAINAQSHIVIDGGTTCGKLSGAVNSNTACNGTIENWLAGTSGQTCPGGACSSQLTDVQFTAAIVENTGNSTDVEIRNLNIGPMYIRAATSSTDGMAAYGVLTYGGTLPQNWRVHNNIIQSAFKGILWSLGTVTATVSDYEAYNNYFTDGCWAYGIGANASTEFIHKVLMYGNEVDNPWVKWAPGVADCHGNGIMIFNGNGSTVFPSGGIGDSTSAIYNNYIHGDLTGGILASSPSGLLSYQDNVTNTPIFNNLVVSTCTGTSPTRSCGGLIYNNGPGGGGNLIYNNTLVGAGGENCFVNTGFTAANVYNNNIATGCANRMTLMTSGFTGVFTSDYEDGYSFTNASNWVCNNAASCWSLATSKTNGQDAHSISGNASLTPAYKLLVGSPAIFAGANLTSAGITALDSDLAGVARPAAGAWDIGAYQYSTSGSPFAYINVSAGKMTVAAGRIAVNAAGGFLSLGYTGTDVVQWAATIPNVGGATKVTTAVYDSAFGSPAPVYRCTDSLTIPNPGTNSSVTGGIGGSGAGILSNLSETLWHVNTGNGGDAIIMFNPATGQCGDPNTGRAITTDKNSAGGGSATSYADFGAGNFSLSQNMTWYSFGGGTGSNATTVLPVTFTSMSAPTNINYTWGSQIADFANGLPNASNTPEWAATTAYANGAYVKHTLTASEYWTWVTGTAVQLGDIMLLSGCAYKVTTAGTTGGTIPTGHTTCNTNSLPLDGSVKWKDLGGPAAFIYQLTSTGGTSGSSTPAFTTTCAGCVSHHADFMATVTDNTTLTWTNVGVAQNPSGIGWISWGGTSADDTKFAETVNTNSYGFSGSYTRCQGGQDCGLWLMEYDSTANKYYLFNTFTGIQSSVTCSGAGGTTCGSWVTQGTITTNIAALPTNGFCQFGLHNEKMNRDGTYAVVVQQGASFGGTCTALNFYVWRPLQTFSATNQLLVFAHGLNHWTPGKNYVAALNDAGYTSPSGVFLTYTPLNNPAATGAFPSCTAGAGNCPLIFWEGHPCNDTPSNEPACTLSISIDAHPSMAYNPGGTDNSPVCTTAYNYGSLSPIETYPYQGEEICIKSSTTWTDSSAPSANPAYRLTHSFNDGTNDQFNTQFGISEYGQGGHWLIFTTDWDSTLGTKDGTDPTCAGVYPCTGGFQVAPPTGKNCLGGMPWQANHNYPLGTVLHPIQGTGGGGTIYEVVQNVACSGTCTSAGTPPAWNTTDPVGTTYTDNAGANQITWKVLSLTGNCRGDLFAVKTAN